MTAMPDVPFHFSARGPTIPAMATLVQREADLSLRAASAFSRLRVCWPTDGADGAPIAVLATENDPQQAAARALSAEGGFIVLGLETTALDVVTVALEWAAEHGRHLGADSDRVLVAGGALAATAALHVRDNGWPRLTRQLLIGEGHLGWPPASASLAGVAPATVVNAPHYAARLREAGVVVRELSAMHPRGFAWMGDAAGTPDVTRPRVDIHPGPRSHRFFSPTACAGRT